MVGLLTGPAALIFAALAVFKERIRATLVECEDVPIDGQKLAN